ncbi:hypothetical protein S83_001246, partial [Arachis hypogaea]
VHAMPMPLILEPSASEFVKLQKFQHSDLERKAFTTSEVREYSKALCAIFSFLEAYDIHLVIPLKITTSEGGYGLHELLKDRKSVLNEKAKVDAYFLHSLFRMLENSFQKKLTIVKNRGAPLLDVRLLIPSGFVTRKWFPLTIL